MGMVTTGFGLALASFCFALLASGQILHPIEAGALKAVRRKLEDPSRFLNWTKSDPCSNWTGVICTQVFDSDGYLHVQELRLFNLGLKGELAPELGQFPNMSILDVMSNNISGTIPMEISFLASLKYLLLSDNQISGSLPDELGSLSNLVILNVDQNRITGAMPKSFANMVSIKHLHMNNNSISGQLPPEIYTLPKLLHLLLDNNNLTGSLPPEFSMFPSIRILQLDNNNFEGTLIPSSYGNISTLLKMSLRNCSLLGPIPDLSSTKGLRYLDLSSNELTGRIPTNRLSNNITTIDLSNNNLTGTIPFNFSGLPYLQRLSLQNNRLDGDVPSSLWQNVNITAVGTLLLDLEGNSFSNISDSSVDHPPNVTIRLHRNPVCDLPNESSISQLCIPSVGDAEVEPPGSSSSPDNSSCGTQSCALGDNFEFVPNPPSSIPCLCAAPLGILVRLRSPTFSYFRPYIRYYQTYLATYLHATELYQIFIPSFVWQKGPRLLIYIKIFPQYTGAGSNQFNHTAIHWLMDQFAAFTFPSDNVLGPYELLNFTLLGPYRNEVPPSLPSGMGKGKLIGIILGSIAGGLVLSLLAVFLFKRKHSKTQEVSVELSKKTFDVSVPKVKIKTENVRELGFSELEAATNGFSATAQIGRGGYGKVYKGSLADGTVVAIKRAQQGSLQGETEFITEIQLLSRVHHRNLVSLVGYCDEQCEQMLVYEYMANGSLGDILSGRSRGCLNFPMRLDIALGSAKGILYLHTEADPPIFHRDVKANNILLDSKFNPKVSDFGLSKLAPAPDSDSNGAPSHVSTVVKGTPGYLDPEYFLTRKLTGKSDVYSLGVVLLELLTGMRPISHGRNLVRVVQEACQSGNVFSVIDEAMGPYSADCVQKLMALALRCCEDKTQARPQMLEIVRDLENIRSMLSDSSSFPSHLGASASGTGSDPLPSSKSEKDLYIPTGYFWGSDLVSGVVPSIRPR